MYRRSVQLRNQHTREMIDTQTGKGDFTLLHNGKIYRFPTESERWEFLCEEAQEKSDTLVINFKPGKERQK